MSIQRIDSLLLLSARPRMLPPVPRPSDTLVNVESWSPGQFAQRPQSVTLLTVTLPTAGTQASAVSAGIEFGAVLSSRRAVWGHG